MNEQATSWYLKDATGAFGGATLARFCKAAGDLRRLYILRVLAQESFGVLELCRIFAMRQPAMSHHLKVLAEAGLLCRRREGNNIYYRRSHRLEQAPLAPLLDRLYQTIDQLTLPREQRVRLDTVQDERAASSQAFFAANADRFAEQQELIAAPDQYLDALLQLIDGLGTPALDTVLELGPGTGWLLPRLAKRAGKLIALDSSAEMLAASKACCATAGVTAVDFILGDHRQLDVLRDAVNLAVVNMVLHHTPSPASVLRDLAAVLRPGGAVLVCELGAHDQTWVREACGDFWLGFAAADLDDWARDAGLVPGESAYLSLRNGFQIQIRLFYLPE